MSDLKNTDFSSEYPDKDFEFSLNIQNTLRSLPKIEAPDDFLASLNEKLDFEDKIKLNTPVIHRRNYLHSWKKYSVLTACLLLAVVLRVDMSNIQDVAHTNNITVEIEETIQITPEVPSTDIVLTPEDTVEAVEVPISDTVTVPEVEPPVSAPKTKQDKPKQTMAKTVNKPVQKAEPQTKEVPSANTVSASAEKVSSSNNSSQPKVLVMKASTPHSDVDLPEGDVIMVDKIVPKKVKFEDYKMVESDALLETFALSEVSDDTVIIATPKAMNAVQNLSFDTDTSSCEVPETNHGAGSGSFFVSVADRQTVASILRKYSSGEKDETFMLSSKNYVSFINELQRQGIEYTDYMITPGRSNVAFKLMAT